MRCRSTHCLIVSAALCLAAACSSADTAPVMASVDLTLSRDRAPLGSPVDMTYAFDVEPGVSMPAGYRVMVHVVDDEERVIWNDDHDPPLDTGEWTAGTPVRYTRTAFVPMIPFLGPATIRVGLYRDEERLRLRGPNEADNESPAREYAVATIDLQSQTESILLVRGGGWHPVEFAADNPTREWEWTEKVATLTFQNPKQDLTFYLESDARPDAFEEPQQVTVRVGGTVVAQFAADQSVSILRRMDIPAALLGTDDRTEIQIEVDKTFVPAERPSGSADTRALGLRVYHAHVEVR